MKNQSQGVKGYHKPEIDMPPLPKIRPKKMLPLPMLACIYCFYRKRKSEQSICLAIVISLACSIQQLFPSTDTSADARSC